MASVGEFLVAYVAADPDLPALIGTRVSPWDGIRKNPLPRIVYGGQFGRTMQTLRRPTSLRRDEVLVDVQAATHEAANEIAALLIGDPDNGDLRLDGYQGTLGGLEVQGCHLDNTTEAYDEPTTQPPAAGVHRVILSFVVWYKLA